MLAKNEGVILKFLKLWLAGDSKAISRTCVGLCSNLSSYYGLNFGWDFVKADEVVKSLSKLFEEDSLDKHYPFGMLEYYKDADNESMCSNPKRVTWVEKTIAKLEYENMLNRDPKTGRIRKSKVKVGDLVCCSGKHKPFGITINKAYKVVATELSHRKNRVSFNSVYPLKSSGFTGTGFFIIDDLGDKIFCRLGVDAFQTEWIKLP